MRLTITIDAPEGTTIRVNPADAEAQYVPPFEDELIPLPEGAMPIPGDVTPFRSMAQNPAQNPAICPVHRMPWKVVPAGISKKNGRAYEAFSACPERGCDQRPAA